MLICIAIKFCCRAKLPWGGLSLGHANLQGEAGTLAASFVCYACFCFDAPGARHLRYDDIFAAKVDASTAQGKAALPTKYTQAPQHFLLFICSLLYPHGLDPVAGLRNVKSRKIEVTEYQLLTYTPL